MWEVIDFLVKALIEHGGIFGLLLAIAIGFIIFREYNLAKKTKDEAAESYTSNASNFDMIKEKQDNQIKLVSQNIEKLGDASRKIQEIHIQLENLISLSKANDKQIEKLREQLQQVNNERVEELKEILNHYNETMNSLTLTLEKIKFVLQTKLGED